MKPVTKLERFVRIASFVAMCVFGFRAFTVHWGWLVPLAAIMAGWWLIFRKEAQEERRWLQEALRQAFAGGPVPQLEVKSSYGFPAFTLTFASTVELRQAEESGRLAAFKRMIQTQYAHAGWKENPFNVQQAVYVTYAGHNPILGSAESAK